MSLEQDRALEIRPAVAADAETVYQMICDLAGALGDSDKLTAQLDDVRRDAFGPEQCYEAWLAYSDGVPVGLLSFYMTYSTYRGAPCLFVDNLYIEPHARRQAVGRALMAQAARIAHERHCCRLDLHVLETNVARDFYEAIGMSLSDELYYWIDADGLRQLTD